jgi:hypothetical protein
MKVVHEFACQQIQRSREIVCAAAVFFCVCVFYVAKLGALYVCPNPPVPSTDRHAASQLVLSTQVQIYHKITVQPRSARARLKE